MQPASLCERPLWPASTRTNSIERELNRRPGRFRLDLLVCGLSFMAVSWRDILEKASANPSSESSKGPARSLKSALSGGYGSPWAASRRDDASSSRDALALELQRAINGQPRPQREAARAAASLAGRDIAYLIAPPAPESQPRSTPLVRANSWRNIVAVIFSFAVIGSTAQAFLNRGERSVRDTTGPAAEPDVRTTVSSAGLAVARTETEPSLEPKSERRGWKPFRNPAAPSIQHGLDGASEEAEAPAAPASRPLLAGLNQVTEQALLDRAAAQLHRGDIGLARVIYETLASYGSSRAALLLAETYEAGSLSQNSIAGSKADPHLARLWYEKAALLGSMEAYRRLNALGQG